ncbi:MAG TPA: molecular chaperone Skp [Firmicutes bacterium]|nr:molecular chaperone Skp [Bacillota bacterium]
MDESPKVKALQAELNRRGQEIMQQLAAEKPQLTPEQYEQKQAEAYKDYEELKKTYELQIDGSIKQAAAQVAKEKRLAVVLHNKDILAGGTDITDEVMRRMKLPLPGKH